MAVITQLINTTNSTETVVSNRIINTTNSTEQISNNRVVNTIGINSDFYTFAMVLGIGISKVGSKSLTVPFKAVYSIKRVVYTMSGFDSVGGTRVYWSSQGNPELLPIITSPALVGTLQYPHIIGIII